MASIDKILVIFDFDSTLVDENSDTVFTKVLTPDLMMDYHDLVVRQGCSWIDTVNTVLRRVHSRGFGAEQIRECFAAHVPISPGMRRLLAHLAASPQRYELIIISDSNALFIDWILTSLGIPASAFAAIFTNRASLSPDGLLSVQPHHEGPSAHACQRADPRCPARLCKTAALERFLKARGVSFARKIYLGDGKGDVCPALSPLMGEGDVVLARRDWAMAKILAAAPTETIRARVVLWTMEDVDEAFKKSEGGIRNSL